MKIVNNTFFIFLIFLLLNVNLVFSEDKIKFKDVSIGSENSQVKIEIYSSLTCPHCANFHKKIYPKIKKEYVDKNLAFVVFKDFPLDLAALNASKLLHCVKNNQKISLLDDLYEKQSQWTNGTDIETINFNLYNIVEKFGLKKNDMTKCINNNDIEDSILNSRINASKEYEINSTPTVIINGKKVEGSISFNNLKKIIEKII